MRQLSNRLSLLETSNGSRLVMRLQKTQSHTCGTRTGLRALQLSVNASNSEGCLGREWTTLLANTICIRNNSRNVAVVPILKGPDVFRKVQSRGIWLELLFISIKSSPCYLCQSKASRHLTPVIPAPFRSLDPNSSSFQPPTFLPPSFLFTRHHKPTSLSQMNCQITHVQLL